MSLNIKLGVSTWLWTSPFKTDTISLFSKIKGMGYDMVEIPIEDPALIDTKRVKEALKEFDLVPAICGAFGPTRDLTNEDVKYHDTSFNYIESCLEIAYEIGAGFFCRTNVFCSR